MKGTRGFRPDIEGLRAVAILLVVTFHAGIPGFGGGFVGVDVFFVVSGYLITELLVDEVARTERIDLSQFYARRTRRLLPGAAIMLVATSIAGWIVYSPLEQQVFAATVIATAAYLSNVWFARGATDYLGSEMDLNPLLHTWSLAVEEQFYLVWPALIGLVSRVRRGASTPLMGAMVLVTVASFTFSVWLTHKSQPWAFFGSPARAWEFGIGAIASLLSSQAKRPSRALAEVVTVAGLFAVFGSSAVLTRTTPFPGTAALWPVLGTAAVLLGGAYAPDQRALWVLNTRPFQTLGRLSYSWYLWHWPLLILAAARFGDVGLGGRLLVIAGALGIAALAHALVENPVRYSAFLVPRRLVSLGVAAAITAFGAGVGVTWRAAARSSAAQPSQRRYAAARDDLPRVYADKCHLGFFEVASPACAYGDTTSDTTVVLFGDSHAANWFPPLERIAIQRHWRLLSLTKSACPSAEVEIFFPTLQRRYTECTEWRAWVRRHVGEVRPNLVVISNHHGYPNHGLLQHPYEFTDEQWSEGVRWTMASFRAMGVPTTVIIDSPVPRFDVPNCLSRASRAGRPRATACAVTRTAATDSVTANDERRAVARVSGAHAIDLTSLICSALVCAPEKDGTIIYRDGNHLTALFSASLADALADSLGVGGRHATVLPHASPPAAPTRRP